MYLEKNLDHILSTKDTNLSTQYHPDLRPTPLAPPTYEVDLCLVCIVPITNTHNTVGHSAIITHCVMNTMCVFAFIG